MRQEYEDYLFSRRIFVADAAGEHAGDHAGGHAGERHPAHALVALARFAEIRITSHPELADLHMVDVAAHNLGRDVPEPFYRGFPESARELSPDLLLFDQLAHYFVTYGTGDFSQAGRSMFEQCYERAAFAETTEPRPFAIVMPEEAESLLAQAVDGMMASSRPVSDSSYKLLLLYLCDHGPQARPCACKDTCCRLLLDLRDPRYADYLTLPDVIRLVEWLLDLRYPGMTLRKLNLRNQDRKLLGSVLDRMLARGGFDVKECLEKKRAWNGLLHHIHYQAKSDQAQAFCDAVRGREGRSAYSEFELFVANGEVRSAARALKASKGSTAVLRNLAYLLSRCESREDVDCVLAAAQTSKKIALIQLITYFYSYDPWLARSFKFVHLNRLYKHDETGHEVAARKTRLDDETVQHALQFLRQALSDACRGTLGRVYAEDALRQIALPLQEAASMGGYGTLPKGSRLPVPQGKKLRAFVYWEKVDDIDLSCFGLDEQGRTQEFSWRTMAAAQSAAVTYSGDQTSGYDGGSEYFDIDLEEFVKLYPNSRYVVFCANVFTRGMRFCDCTCRAGYMLRDGQDSGEVFEPKTVQSSFAVSAASSAAYLFALDLYDCAFVWLNMAEQSVRAVAGEGSLAFLLGYMHVVEAMSLYDFAHLLASEAVDSAQNAEVVFGDGEYVLHDGQEQIRSHDTERILELLNG